MDQMSFILFIREMNHDRFFFKINIYNLLNGNVIIFLLKKVMG
jgi:hypothetical protein